MKMSEYLLLGLLGHPISQSLSPLLHNAALQFCGLSGEYRLFDIPPEKFDDGLKNMLKQNIKGFNITIPYKERIYSLISDYTNDALQVGAVNTVKVDENKKFSGHNTDIIGFKLAFQEKFGTNFRNDTALIIGTGGAAKAVVVALRQLGFKKISIQSRSIDKAKKFINEVKSKIATTCNDALIFSIHESNAADYQTIDLIVNASPIGMEDNAPEWLENLMNKLSDKCLCFDLVYSKANVQPIFYRLAKARSLQAIEGLPMLVHQARFAFEYWTGVEVPAEVLYSSIQAISM